MAGQPINQDDDEDEADSYSDDEDDNDEYGDIVDILEPEAEAQEVALETRSNRERQTYTRLIRAGANLPPLEPAQPSDRRPFTDEQLDAFFSELERRGALDIRRLEDVRETGGEVSTREIFDVLRSFGYVWRPRMRWARGRITPAGWSTSSEGNRSYWTTINREVFREVALDYRRRVSSEATA